MIIWVTSLMVVLVLTAIIYSAILFWISSAIKGYPSCPQDIEQTHAKDQISIKVSIVVPARNESGSILECLESLRKQSFSRDWEVILSDDFSVDNTILKAEEFHSKYPAFPLIFIQPEAGHSIGKKAAITRGVKAASGQIILITDADTVREEDWLYSMYSCFTTTTVKMVVAPVILQHDDSLFGRIQYTEFLGVMGVTMGAIAIKRPVMCNGANLAFRRETFLELGGYTGNNKIASGDDYFLMQKIVGSYGSAAVIFNPQREAIVWTPVQRNLSAFFGQRMRWGSKGTSYRESFVIILSLATLMMPVVVLAGLLAGLINPVFFTVAPVILALKMMVDSRIVNITAKKLQCSFRWLDFLTGEVFQLLYIPIAGFMALLFPYNWKGRTIRKRDSGKS